MSQNTSRQSVLHAVQQIDAQISNNRNKYFNRMLGKSLGSFVLFDNNGASYFGNLRPLSIVERNDHLYHNSHRHYFAIEFFANDSSLKTAADNHYIARLHFSHAKANMRKITLEMIHTSESYKGNGIGSNMLKLLNLYCINTNVELVIGLILPFDYKGKQIESVKRFYEKEHYTITTKKINYHEVASGDKLKFVLSESLRNETKHRIITVPAASRDYITLFQSSQIHSSSWQDKPLE